MCVSTQGSPLVSSLTVKSHYNIAPTYDESVTTKTLLLNAVKRHLKAKRKQLQRATKIPLSAQRSLGLVHKAPPALETMEPEIVPFRSYSLPICL